MTTLEKTEALQDAFYHGELTYEELVRLMSGIQAKCQHVTTRTYCDDNDFYVWCVDCAEEL